MILNIKFGEKELKLIAVLGIVSFVYWTIKYGLVDAATRIFLLFVVFVSSVFVILLSMYLLFYAVCCFKDGFKETHDAIGLKALLSDVSTENSASDEE